MDYEKYKSLGGKLTEDEFIAHYRSALVMLRTVINSKVAYWNIEDSLYSDPCFDLALTTQIDYSAEVERERGRMAQGLKSIQTDGYTIEYDQSQSNYLDGSAVSSVAIDLITHELRKKGLMVRSLC